MREDVFGPGNLFFNIVVRSSRVRGEREKTKEDRIDERKQCKHNKQVPVLL